MKTLRIPLLLAVLALLLNSCGYNTMVEQQETVDQKWANVQTQYQRRADLIDNLVATVKGAAENEKSILTDVIEARSKATSMNINADELTPENIKKFQDAQSQLSGAFSKLMVSVERYPEIKSNQNFRDLQVQIEGTENRIAVARTDFNTAVKEYNAYIRKIPQNIIAGFAGFEKKGYFEADSGSEKAPKVEF
ncbi:MAG: LemA family protein [Salibacteraceae bacterium]|jgi:LemA protein|nr:LemA family protein [Salibacteraceae bacterium]MDP4685246.1 LemA family protein [Salibacteraceae bacterium]MDP4762948.1 LemA family protein [Salibacteraceae bacterium]MDP4935730.1 LemA family protein [Salibacteraceae bacterium]MDP4965510.1 LemA family protein [Salibacteraceae bacterium]